MVFAAPASSSGKTTLALLLALWARKQGLRVAPFKAGPDFLDPQFLGQAAGQPGRNLDPWFSDPVQLRQLFSQGAGSAQLSIIEGVMGLYDGKRGAAFGEHSTSTVARALDAPIVLVVSARKAGVTLAAQVAGLVHAGKGLRFAGVILNDCPSVKTAKMLAPALRKIAGLNLLGWLPRIPALTLPERHLGLTAPSELQGWLKRAESVLPQVEASVDFKALLRVARAASNLVVKARLPLVPPKVRFRLGVARDAAFHFYYQENLELLTELGADIHEFSPLKSQALPKGIQGLLLGGGFPELFGTGLAANRSLMADVRKSISAGMPLWAECGGLMWLCEQMIDLKGKRHKLVGALSATVAMGPRLTHFGYTSARATVASAVAPRAATWRGHEFHHSELRWTGKAPPALWRLSQTARPDRPEGWKVGNGVATYLHSYLPSAPNLARRFAQACLKFS